MFSGLENFPLPPVCSVSVVLFRLFGSAEHAGWSESRVQNRGCEIGLRQAERPSPPVCSVSVVLFRLFGSAEHAGWSESRVQNRGCEIGLRQAERPSPPVCSVSVVLFRLFGSAEHSGRLKSGCEIGLRNRASAGRASFASGLFRLRGSVSALRVGGTLGSAEHSGRSESRVRNRGCEIGLRQAERPSPPVCSVSVVLFRLFRLAGHAGRSKSSCEIGLRRVECFSERKTSFDYIFVYNIKRKGWCHWW